MHTSRSAKDARTFGVNLTKSPVSLRLPLSITFVSRQTRRGIKNNGS